MIMWKVFSLNAYTKRDPEILQPYSLYTQLRKTQTQQNYLHEGIQQSYMQQLQKFPGICWLKFTGIATVNTVMYIGKWYVVKHDCCIYYVWVDRAS